MGTCPLCPKEADGVDFNQPESKRGRPFFLFAELHLTLCMCPGGMKRCLTGEAPQLHNGQDWNTLPGERAGSDPDLMRESYEVFGNKK